MLKKTCFAIVYRICAISSQSSHLHKSDFPFQNTQKDVFYNGLSHLCKLKSELALAQIGFHIVNAQKDVFCYGISHLCNFKSEFTFAQIRFSIAKHSKRRALQWIIAFVQIKVRVGTCTKQISQYKTLKKTSFAMEYRICAISSQSCTNRIFRCKNSNIRVLQRIIVFVQIKVSVGTCTKRISHRKTLKKICFGMEYRISAISSQGSHLHKSDFPSQNIQKDVYDNGLSHLYKFKSELALAQIGFPIVKCSKICVLQCNITFVQFKVRVTLARSVGLEIGTKCRFGHWHEVYV